MTEPLQILGVAQGTFALGLIKSATAAGIRMNGEWEDLGLFVKMVNNGWAQDPGASTGWFPPKIFHGVPRLHLPRTLTLLAVTTYLIHSFNIVSEPLAPGVMPVRRSWLGSIPRSMALEGGEASASQVIHLKEIMYFYDPPPVNHGSQTAVADTYGLGPFQPEVGMGILYGFARAEGDIQGFSMPFLERDGRLLPVCLTETPSSELSSRFLQHPWNPSRVERHLERYFDEFDMPKALADAWNRAAIHCLRQFLGPDAILGVA